MEQNFQTSFIPKKPIIEERTAAPRPVSFFNVIAIFIFFTMLVTSVGVYFYQNYLVGQITTMDTSLNSAKGRFEPAAIVQLQTLDKRLSAAKEVLAKHIAISPIFQLLQTVTMKTVRYTSFSYTFVTDKSNKINIKMSGGAVGYRSIALQSDLFTKRKEIIDPIFSNLALDDKGNVLFDLDFSIDSSLIDYKTMLQRSIDQPVNVVPINNN